MVGRIKGITIELSADTTKATKSLDKFEKATNQVAARLKDINRVLKLNPASTEALTQKQQALKLQVDKTTEQLRMEKQALEQLQAGPQTEKTIDAQRRLKLQIEETTAKLVQAEAAYKSFGSVGVQQLALVGKKLEAFGQSVSAAGRSLTTGLTLPIALLGGNSVKSLADFEQAMAGVGAVSQASGEELEQMGSYARELAATTKFTANEVTDAYHYMALAGWEPTQMMDGLEGVLNLVAASGEDLGTVSDIVTDGLTAMGEAADQSGRFADVFAVAMSKSNTNVEQLGEAFKYVAPVAGAMGYEIEDLATALGTMANAGIKGSTAGTTLRSILTNMANPTESMAIAMDEIGVSLYNDEGRMYSMAEVMDQLRAGLGNLAGNFLATSAEAQQLSADLEEGTITEDEYAEAIQGLIAVEYGAEEAHKAQLAAMLAGKRGMAGLLAIVSASEEDWNGLASAIYNAEGASQEMRETMENTLSGQFTILKSQLAELAMQFGEAMLPAIKDLVAWLQNLVTRFQALSPEQKQMIVRIAAIVAAIGPLLFVGGKLLTGIGKFMQMPAKIISGVATVTSKFKLFAAALGTTTGPILAIVAAIGVLIAAFVTLWKNSETFRTNITNAFNQIKAAGSMLFNGLNIDLSKIVEGFKSAWNWFAETLAPVFEGIFQAIADVFSGAVDVILGIVDFFKGAFTGDWEKMWNGARQIFTGVVNAILGIGKNIFMGLFKALNSILTKLGQLFAKIFTAIKDSVIQRVTWMRTKTVEATQKMKEVLFTKFQQLREGVRNRIQAMREGVVNRIQAMRESVQNRVQAMKEWLFNKFQQIREGVRNRIQAMREGVVNRIQAMREGVQNRIQAMRESVVEKVQAIKDKITGKFQDAKDTVTNTVQSLKQKVVDKIEALKWTVGSTFESIKQKIISPFESARDTVDGIVQKIKGFFPINFGKIFSNLGLPKISVDPGAFPWGIGGKGRKPSFSVSTDWFAKAMRNGMILDSPTIFGYANGRFLAGGEAGSETVVGTNSLMGMIQHAARTNTIDPNLVYEAVRQGASDAVIRNYLSGRDVTNQIGRQITQNQNAAARFQGAN